ncbi:Cupin-like domain-containing protein [Duganella sp. CF458]|uniref:cupin-like domain-containing protein n=1 Tax=Duganella sp. CF458 TaxID=1884368 RepID=UPI0008E7BCC5|nr:cupin-like domain-containing protein [Duganella sp. CF458]SFG76727.1 Cupin-like domain-containing protein [Duganella sp. CF458]
MQASAEPIRELHGVTPSDLGGELLGSTEPLVLRGLLARWPAVQAGCNGVDSIARAASADAYLRRFCRDATVIAMLGSPDIGGRVFYNEDLSGFNFSSVHTRLDHVLMELARQRDNPNSPAIYVGSTTVDTALPGYSDENALAMVPRDALMSIWIGNQVRIPAHYDLPDNLACVTAGRRRFTLFPPDQLENLYVGPLDFTPAGQPISLVDLHHPDIERFPRFGEAMRHAQSAELAPGDAIFIPSMWWHHVEALECFNVLVNYWWRQSPAFMDTPANALMLSLLSIRDLPPAQRRAWQEIFRHYVFEADEQTAAHIPKSARRVLGAIDDNSARMLRAQLLKKINR